MRWAASIDPDVLGCDSRLEPDPRVRSRATVWSARCGDRIHNQLRRNLWISRVALPHQHRTILHRGICAWGVARMKVVLLALSGDLSRWHDKLVQLYPDCSIEMISRAEFETGSHLKRLKSLRALRPDVLAIGTERLPWQRGQNLFMVFGALAGAREVLMMDAHGGLVRKSRSNVLLGAPVRLGRETLTSANDIAQSRRELQRLEEQTLRFAD